jgi:hypothetical protein
LERLGSAAVTSSSLLGVSVLLAANPRWTDTGFMVTNGGIISFPAAETWSPGGNRLWRGLEGDDLPSSDDFLGPPAWSRLIVFVEGNPYP